MPFTGKGDRGAEPHSAPSLVPPAVVEHDGSDWAVYCEALRREYRGHHSRRAPIVALDALDLRIRYGEVYGLLGPNGAGKTTAIKILTTLLRPTSGIARVGGHLVDEDARQVRARIGFSLGGDRGFYLRLSAYDNLLYFGVMAGLTWRRARHEASRLLESVGLADAQHRSVEQYSRGMRQRLHIARCLIGQPSILFLDEPSAGLDPEGARAVRELVHSLRDEARTILITTHYLHEADALCDRVGILDRGKLLLEGHPDAVKARAANLEVIEIQVFGLGEGVEHRLSRLPDVSEVRVESGPELSTILVRCRRAQHLAEQVLAELRKDGRIASILTREATLEDAYLALLREARAGTLNATSVT